MKPQYWLNFRGLRHEEDRFKGLIIYRSQKINAPWGSFYLVGAKSLSGKPEQFNLVAQVAADVGAHSWEAYADGGKRLKTQTGKIDVSCFLGCTVGIQVFAILDKQTLSARRASGLEIQLSSLQGGLKYIAPIPASTINELLNVYGK